MRRTGWTAEAVVDLDAIAHNTELISGYAGTTVLAVVKADAFGHGLLAVARTVVAHGAEWLGVASCAEALRLRVAGVTAPVLSWLHAHDTDVAPAIEADVDLSVASAEQLWGVAAGAAAVGRPASVHLKIDTGLCRNGAQPGDWPTLVALARQLERERLVRVRGVWSHLVSANDPGTPQVRRQVDLFDDAVAVAHAAGLAPELRHIANSAAALDAPACRYDLVRPGVGLYGVEPVTGKRFGLRAAMTLRARAIVVKRVPAGCGVSYDHSYVTRRDSTLALVPIGYADGVPRSASGRAEVWSGGRRHPVAGTVAMDQFVVDLGDCPAAAGDEVVLIGPGHQGEPTVTDWANWAGTIPHEIFTGIGHRVPRRYVGRCASENRIEESARE